VKRFISAPIRLFVALVILQTDSCSKDDLSNELRITNVTPAFGGSGRRITIESNDAFSGDLSDQAVTFGKSIAAVISVTKSSMTVRVPDNAGSGSIRVISNGNAFEWPGFQYIDLLPVEYFIRFKQDGVFVEGIMLTDSRPGENCVINDAGPCHELIAFIQGHAKEAYLELHLDHDNTEESLQALYGVAIPVRARTTPPAITFGLNLPEGNLISDDADQIGTKGIFKITRLTYHSSFLSDFDVYDAEGTFECVIRDKYNDITSVITDGTFRIPLAAMVE
jgi:hypothetical protein